MSLLNGTTLNPYYINPYNSGTSLFDGTFNFPSLSSTSLYDIYRNSFLTNNNNFGLGKRTTSNGLGNSIADTAKSYRGYKESDGSYKLFTNGRKEAWCADFVTYVVKEACRKEGKSVPQGFGSSSVEGLRQWGKNNNCYLDITNSSNKSTAIANNIKVGDVVIFKGGISHTGVVTKINPDGSFQTIEGNTSDKVDYRNYAATDSRISGFVQVA